MRLHCIGNMHRQKHHDLIDGSIELSTVTGRSSIGRSVDIENTGLDYIAVKWVQECNLGKGSYEFTLELAHKDIARLFLDAFGNASFAVVSNFLAAASHASSGGKR